MELHVGGIIGAAGNNSIGVSGVCWNITLVPLQVVNSEGSFPIDDVIEAINYATNNNIPILNYSGGGYNYNFAYEQAIKNYPGLFICSTGNGRDHDNNPNTSNVPVDTDITPHYPSSFPLSNIISVANTTNSDTLSSSSNYGDTTVDLAAPGTGILSTYPTSLTSSGYKSLSGTSMAAPHVTGVAALMKSINPDLTAIKIKN